MSYQNISFAMAQADVDSVKASIANINSKMPFLISLDPAERQALPKLGPKSADFANDASLAMTSFPDVLPASFDKTEFAKDTALFSYLREIKTLLNSLCEKVDDTYLAVGSETMQASREVYAYVQTAKNRTPGLGRAAEKLKYRFKGQGKKKRANDTKLLGDSSE